VKFVVEIFYYFSALFFISIVIFYYFSNCKYFLSTGKVDQPQFHSEVITKARQDQNTNQENLNGFSEEEKAPKAVKLGRGRKRLR
jgi:hypothetical protein